MIKRNVAFTVSLSLLMFFIVACKTTTGANDISLIKTDMPYQVSINVEPRVIFKDVMGLSSEGGYLQAIMLGNKMQYLNVRLFGVMGQIGFSYSFFANNNVVITITEENFTEPFYMMSDGIISIYSIERNQYFLRDGKLYIISSESDEIHEVTGDERNKIINQMNYFTDKVFE